MDVAIRFAKTSDHVSIAYFAVGAGSPIVIMPGLASHLESELASWRRPLYEKLASHHQVVRYDGRGQGMSGSWEGGISLETQKQDLSGVLDAVGLDRFALVAVALGCPGAINYAVEEPSRLTHLVLWNPFASAADYFKTTVGDVVSLVDSNWPVFIRTMAHIRLGWDNSTAARKMAEVLEASIDPEYYHKILSGAARLDAKASLEAVTTPTLVVHRADYDPVAGRFSEDIVTRIPNAELAITGGDLRTDVYSEIARFIAGRAERSGLPEYMKNRSPALTQREIEVLRLVAAGKHNKEIAADLNLSLNTVERHVATIYVKSGVHGRVDAARFALEHGLISDRPNA